MPELLNELGIPDDWNDYPETAKTNHLQNNIRLEDYTNLVIETFDLPENNREEFPYLNKRQWIALVQALDNIEDGDNE